MKEVHSTTLAGDGDKTALPFNSDQQYWVDRRAAIIQAIADEGLEIWSDKDRVWLHRKAASLPRATLPDGVTPDDGMDGKYIERRIERWFVEGLHCGDLSKCPYNEATHAERWWRRGCNSAVRIASGDKHD